MPLSPGPPGRLQDRSLDLVISSTRPRRAGLRATPCYDETFTLVAAPHWAPHWAPHAPVLPDLRGALTATFAGAGLTVLPTYLCHPHLTNGTLVPLATPEVPPLNTLYLVTRTDAGPTTAATQEHLLAVLR